MFEHSPSPPSFWDQAAERWDALLADGRSFPNHEEAFRRFHWFMRRSMRIGNRCRSYHLLDLGCGTGEAAWPIWRRVVAITFFDRSARMLRLARNKAPKGVFVRGDAERLPFLDGEFDVIVSRGCLISQLDPASVPGFLFHVWRVLRQQGTFIFDFVCDQRRWFGPPHLYPGSWSREAMMALIQEHLPDAKILAYDGTDRHGVNRILIKKTNNYV